jgi:O-antigen/teichoic acid export membrane protein
MKLQVGSKRRFERWFVSQFAGNAFALRVLSLSSTTVVAQVIGILATPILSRIYTPAEYGLFSTFAAILAIAASVSSLKYEWAIVVAEHESDAVALVRLCLWLAAASATVVFIGTALFAVNVVAVPSFYWLLAPSLFLTTVALTFRSWANRKAMYKVIGFSDIATSTTAMVARIGFGVSGLGIWGMAISDIISRVVNILVLPYRQIDLRDQSTSVRSVFHRYRRFYRYSAPAAFLNAVSYNFEYVLFVALFSPAQIGAYYFWNRLIAIPKQFISASIWQVFLQDASLLTPYEIGVRVYKRQKILIALTSMPYYSGMIALPSILVLVFGSQWAEYSNLISPILIGGHLNLVVSSFSIFVLLKKNESELAFNALLPAAKIGIVLLAYFLSGDFVVVIWMLALTQALLFWGLGEWNYAMTGLSRGAFSLLYLRWGIMPILPFLVVLALTFSLTDSLSIHLATLFIVNAGYYFMLWRLNLHRFSLWRLSRKV